MNSRKKFSLEKIKNRAYLIKKQSISEQRKFVRLWVYLQCIDTKINKKNLTQGMIVDWVNDAKKIFMTKESRFYDASLSQAWINKFKFKYDITGDQLNLQLRYENKFDNIVQSWKTETVKNPSVDFSKKNVDSPGSLGVSENWRNPMKDKCLSTSSPRLKKSSNLKADSRAQLVQPFFPKKHVWNGELNSHHRAFLYKKNFIEKLRRSWSTEGASSFNKKDTIFSDLIVISSDDDADIDDDEIVIENGPDLNFLENIFDGFCVSYLKTNVCHEKRDKGSCSYEHNINYHQDKSLAVLKAIILYAIDEEFYDYVYNIISISVGKLDEKALEEIYRKINWQFPKEGIKKQTLLDLLFDEFREKSPYLNAMMYDQYSS